MTTEVWRPVPGWEGLYEASNLGRLRSFDKIVMRKNGRPLPVPGRIMRTSLNSGGYPSTVLVRDGVRTSVGVHMVVAAAFLGPRPDGAEVLHYDDVKTNNTVGNLRYGSRSDNSYDRVRNGIHNQARKAECPKGHPYDEGNTYRPPGSSGIRYCLKCHRDAARDGMRALRVARRAAGLVDREGDAA